MIISSKLLDSDDFDFSVLNQKLIYVEYHIQFYFLPMDNKDNGWIIIKANLSYSIKLKSK